MENLMLDLIDEFLDINEEQKETWKVEDDLGADWCLDKIRESKAEYNRFEMVAKAKIQQIEQALQKEKQKMESEVGFFETKLRAYFKTIEDQAKETKTLKKYKLPSGELNLKKSKMIFDYHKDKLLKYAKENKMKDYIKVTESFKWADFKKNLEIKGADILNKETGELLDIDGLSVTETFEEFNVEV